MSANGYVDRLENIVKKMLTPLRNVPFNLVIESLTGKKVLAFDSSKSEHLQVLDLLKQAALTAGKMVNMNGIMRPRPNEVGNDIEPYVKSALNALGLNAGTPTCSSGKRKSTGYPDLLFWFKNNPYYLECKTYNAKIIDTTLRSFYFSPSDDFKVTYDAPHFMVSFEIFVSGEQGNNHVYKCKHYKILSIESLSLDVKYEFNSDNRRIYSARNGTVLLADGEI